MNLSDRQKEILKMVKEGGPLSGSMIACRLGLSRASLRSDFAFLTQTGILDSRTRVGYFYNKEKKKNNSLSGQLDRKTGDFCSLPVSISLDSTVYDAIAAIFIQDVGTLFVKDGNGFLAGVVSRKDLLKSVVREKDIRKISVAAVMTAMPDIITADPGESVLEAAGKMVDFKIDSLPVGRFRETGSGKGFVAEGRFSKTNVARLFAQLDREED